MLWGPGLTDRIPGRILADNEDKFNYFQHLQGGPANQGYLRFIFSAPL
jgi:hypothetical protein